MTNEKINIRNIARWVISRKDLPNTDDEADYLVTKENRAERIVTLSKRNRQVLEALRIGPIHCASPVRQSDVVMILRRDYGLSIETEYYTDTQADDGVVFGIYSLVDNVSRATSANLEAA